MAGKKIGDFLPDKEVVNDKRPKYEILEITNDYIKCVEIGTMASILGGKYTFRWRIEEVPKVSKEELANDIIHMDRISFMRKYKDVDRKHSFHIHQFSRKAKTTYNNDVWRWLEGDGVFGAIKQAGFDIVKSKEKGQITYAVFPTAKITGLKEVKV